jgi:hypothetical protein
MSGNVDSVYPFRAGFVYIPDIDPVTGAVAHNFYVFAGRLNAEGSTVRGNTQGFDVVTLFYRQAP